MKANYIKTKNKGKENYIMQIIQCLMGNGLMIFKFRVNIILIKMMKIIIMMVCGKMEYRKALENMFIKQEVYIVEMLKMI